jgi:hypothetical protein
MNPRPEARERRRSLAWRLNWYRQGELDGAMLLGRAVRSAPDAALMASLTRHSAEEAEHSRLWSAAISAMGLPHLRILRSYQSFYADEGALPGDLVEVLALTHVFERRVDRLFRRELADPATPAPVRDALRTMLDDERGHLAWVAAQLRREPRAESLLRRYAEADEAVFRRLEPFRDRLWDLPGLGVEPPGAFGRDISAEAENKEALCC